MSGVGLVSRVTPVHTALRNCTRDEGRPFEFGNQVLISSHRKLLSSKAMVVNVAEKSGHDPVRQGGGAKLNQALVWNVRTWPAMPREKAQAAPTVRLKVPMRRRGADCLVVATKWGNAHGAKGVGHRR